ncbi:MAG: hypothetical protein B7C24_15255 [Bacteroidetes bacterium 4572_77]|nr:MAG: hypothetical protein B7C24_15255 [Bacteroidetes bacterium 4572_77]
MLSKELLSRLNDMVFIIDFQGKVLDSGKEGLSIENIQSVLSKKDWEIISSIIAKDLSEKDQLVEMELELKINKKLRWFWCKMGVVSEVNNKEKEFFLGFCDIQQLKEKEENLRKEKEKAESQEKIKTSFLANMSHEIRTPMNSIIGFSELVKETDDLEEKNQYIDIIKTSGQYLLNIINDIIDISKIESGILDIKVQRTNVNDLIDKLCNIYLEDKRLNTDKVKLYSIKTLDTESATILTDPTRIRQILSNLIDNAIKFTTKGSVEIGYQLKKGSSVHPNGEICFYVKDTGPGIRKSEQDLVFDRFHQVREGDEIRGSGLGLAIVEALVSKLGGKIIVDSVYGEGSTFSFCIPYLKREKDPIIGGKIKKTTVTKPNLKNKHVLVAEDVPANFKFISAVLRGTNAKLTWAKNGKEAVEFVLSGTEFDMVLMDLRMPIMDGYKASAHIKTIAPKLPIVALTAFAVDGDMEKALEAGCDDYLSKPVSIPDLYAKFRLFLGV